MFEWIKTVLAGDYAATVIGEEEEGTITGTDFAAEDINILKVAVTDTRAYSNSNGAYRRPCSIRLAC
jgi:hypothetical protein